MNNKLKCEFHQTSPNYNNYSNVKNDDLLKNYKL